jgi:hypothetical protein
MSAPLPSIATPDGEMVCARERWQLSRGRPGERIPGDPPSVSPDPCFRCPGCRSPCPPEAPRQSHEAPAVNTIRFRLSGTPGTPSGIRCKFADRPAPPLDRAEAHVPGALASQAAPAMTVNRATSTRFPLVGC